jgi:hypothetical protein
MGAKPGFSGASRFEGKLDQLACCGRRVNVLRHERDGQCSWLFAFRCRLELVSNSGPFEGSTNLLEMWAGRIRIANTKEQLIRTGGKAVLSEFDLS